MPLPRGSVRQDFMDCFARFDNKLLVSGCKFVAASSMIPIIVIEFINKNATLVQSVNFWIQFSFMNQDKISESPKGRYLGRSQQGFTF